MVSAVVCLLVILLGSSSPAPLTGENDSSATSSGLPRSIQKIEITFNNRSQEVMPGFIRQLNKLEDRLKTITSERLDSVIGKVHTSVSSIVRLKDRLQGLRNKFHWSRPRPGTRGRLNATTTSSTKAENISRSGVTENVSASETHGDGDHNEPLAIGYEAYIDELIRGGFIDVEYTTRAPSEENTDTYLDVGGFAEATEHSSSTSEYNNFFKTKDSGNVTDSASHLPTTLDDTVTKKQAVNAISNDTRKHPEDTISFSEKERNSGEKLEDGSKNDESKEAFAEKDFRILTDALQETTQETSIEHNTIGNYSILMTLFTPAERIGSTSPDCMCGSYSKHRHNLRNVTSENKTQYLQTTSNKHTEINPFQLSKSRKDYVKRQAPDVLAFTSELSQPEENSDETNVKDDFRDDYDEAKDGRNGERPGSDDYEIQESDNTHVVSLKKPVNFTREIKILDTTVGFYASTVLELLPYVREGYLNNNFTDEEIDVFKNMFGSMWTLINNTELINNITRISNISDAEANEEIAKAFRETETSRDKTLVRRTRSVSDDGKKQKRRHSSAKGGERKRSERRRTRSESRDHGSSPEATKHRRKHKRKHVNEQQTDRPQGIDRNKSKRHPRSHGAVNTTVISEAAAILALLAEDGAHIQLDDPGEDDYYDEGDDYTYDDNYDAGGNQYYYDDEDMSAELAEYYNNHDDASVRELIKLASRHRDRKAKTKNGTNETLTSRRRK